MDFAKIILEELERRTLNVNQAELAYNFPQGFIRGVVRQDEKRAIPSIKKAEEICRALGLEFYIGPPRETGVVENVTLDGAEYAHITLHDSLLAAGPGSCNDNELVVEHLAFRRDWLKRVGVSASAAALARVHGDSMQPSMWDGDMVLVNSHQKEPVIRTRDPKDRRRAPIYALIDDGEARVKRIERPSADTVMLISDNPDYSPELHLFRDIDIIGKVVWWGHTVKE